MPEFPEPSPEVAARMADSERIGNAVVAHINSGADSDEPIWAEHYHPNYASIEADGMTHTGLDQIREKHAQWFGMFDVHGVKAEGPYITQNGFCVRLEMDVEAKDGSMPRMQMAEIGHYTVEGGKVTREEFFTPPMTRG